MMARIYSIVIALILCLSIGFIPMGPAVASRPMVLTVEDLPMGFTPISPTEIEGCQPQGDHGELAAFVSQPANQPQTSICMSSFLLTEQAANEAQAALMRQMMDAILDNPQAMTEQAATNAGVEVLSHPPQVGDKATGFAKQDGHQRYETLLFRRGDILSSIAIHYDDSAFPAISLSTVAHRLDQHLSQLMAQTSRSS